MNNLAFVTDSLRAQASDAPLDDSQLTNIVTLWDAAKYEEAGEAAAELWRMGVHDIRVVVYSLHCYFVAGGPARLSEIMAAVAALLTDHGEKVGPARLRKGHFDKRLSWLFRTILDNLRCQGTAQAIGATWPESLSAGTRDQTLDAAEALSKVLEQEMLSETRSALGGLMSEVRQMPVQAAAKASDLPSVREAAVALPSASDSMGSAAQLVSEKLERALGADGLAPRTFSVNVEVSADFVALCTKMKVFRELVARKSFTRAAIVADDVNQLIASFDPVTYFPEIFRAYMTELAGHIGDVAPCWEERDGVEWMTLRQLYRTHIVGFSKD